MSNWDITLIAVGVIILVAAAKYVYERFTKDFRASSFVEQISAKEFKSQKRDYTVQ